MQELECIGAYLRIEQKRFGERLRLEQSVPDEHAGQENHVLRGAMSSLVSHLPPQRFMRLSRSVIVKLDPIQELQSMFKGENRVVLVVLKNGKSYLTTRPIREIQQKLEFR